MSRVIYTRTGDQGDTSLACGQRLPKDDLRIDAYGTIDELSSVLGVVSALLAKLNKPDGALCYDQVVFIEWVQDKLFTLSSMIATANLPAGNLPELLAEDVAFLERHIDEMEVGLPELRNFILPGGSELVSFIHLARTVCRRSERVCTALGREIKLNPVMLPFLNRLSDDLFVMARWVCYQTNEEEKVWLGRKQPAPRASRCNTREIVAHKLLREDPIEQLQLFDLPLEPAG